MDMIVILAEGMRSSESRNALGIFADRFALVNARAAPTWQRFARSRLKCRRHAGDQHIRLARLQAEGIDRQSPGRGAARGQINRRRAGFELASDLDGRVLESAPTSRRTIGHSSARSTSCTVAPPRSARAGRDRRRDFSQSGPIGRIVAGGESFERHKQAHDFFLAHFHRAAEAMVRNAAFARSRIDERRRRIPQLGQEIQVPHLQRGRSRSGPADRKECPTLAVRESLCRR